MNGSSGVDRSFYYSYPNSLSMAVVAANGDMRDRSAIENIAVQSSCFHSNRYQPNSNGDNTMVASWMAIALNTLQQ